MTMTKLTPMLRQYLSIKEQYPDAILLYRMGDFYEMFYEDARTAAGVLEITLTSRNKKDGDDAAVPMCGVPVRAAQGYIARLIESGHRVAVCEQVEDPATAKGLVAREVTRVITPGMIIEDAFLDEKSNNFILAAAAHGDTLGIGWMDLSTGDFKMTESESADQLAEEIRRVAPTEALLPEAFRPAKDGVRALVAAAEGAAITYLEDRRFEFSAAYEALTRQFKTLTLEGFGCEGMKAGIRAAGALMAYVRETQKRAVDQFLRVEPHNIATHLGVDEVSARNLELLRNLRDGSIRGTLLSVLDRTVTAMGGRMMKQWLRYPLMDMAAIERRLTAVEEAKSRPAERAGSRGMLKTVADLERLGSKILMAQCNARDLVAVKRSLQALPELMATLGTLPSPLFRPEADMAPLAELAEAMEAAIRDDAPLTITEGGLIKKGYDPELDQLIRIAGDGKGWLAELEARERSGTGIGNLKVRYNKVFGYYIEIPKMRAAEAPARYARKQTLVNAERFITEELKDFESKVLDAEQRRGALEYDIFDRIRRRVADRNPLIQAAARFISRADCLLALAECAEADRHVRPALNDQGRLWLINARHPVVEKTISGERFVPNTIKMDNESEQVLIITGPNMAGKSTVLRQAALLTLMAHMGAFVPAESADIPITDRIFTRVGALDNLSGGQSTFMVEMQETANILNNATPRSLVILDEIGRGTSTFDGLAIAWAVAEYLHDRDGRGVKTLFATHYHELTALADQKPRVKNYNIAVKEWRDDIIFLRKLVEGGTDRSYGIQVARLAGIPRSVIDRAWTVLAEVNRESGGHVPRPAEAGAKKSGHRQLGLFPEPDGGIAAALRKIDPERITPIEALNHLIALKEKAARFG